MKKLLAIAMVSAWLAACNDGQTDNKPIESPGTNTPESQEPATPAYTPDNGDVSYREGKVMVWRNGEWKEADDKIKLDNGAIVHQDGRVIRDGKEITLQDGELIDEEGNIFDRTGKAVESAWKDTKEGVKEAGKEIEKGANKAGDKIEDAVDDDKK